MLSQFCEFVTDDGGPRNFFSYACSGQFRAAAVFNKLIFWVIVKYYGLG